MSGTDERGASPFERADLADRYEAWYATPYGAVADRIESALILELLAPVGPAVPGAPGASDAASAPGPTVLEIGCGTAHFAAALAGAGYRAFGVDPARPMLARARERVPVACADGLRLPFADGAVDAAVLAFVLELVGDPVALLREARRVARRRVVVLTLTSRSWLGLRRRVSGRLGNPIFSRVTYRSRARVLALAREAGAEVEFLRSVLFLPPALAGRLPRLEERLSRGSLPGAGVLGLALSGGASV